MKTLSVMTVALLIGTPNAASRALSPTVPAATTQAEQFAGHFVVLDASEALTSQFGLLMECPAHAHGTADQAYAELQKMMVGRPPAIRSAIWVCQSDQLETLKRFSPLVNHVIINPYRLTNDRGPEPDCPIWPGVNDPIINGVRQIRLSSGNVRLLANIWLDGGDPHFTKRPASFEEIQWMIYAVVGANFQGIVWRNQQAVMAPERLKPMIDGLLAHAADLADAKPVKWAVGDSGSLVSALLAGGKLYVVVLNPNYMKLAQDKVAVRLPVTPEKCRGEFSLSLPAGLTIASSQLLSGQAVEVQMDGGIPKVRYSFGNGGTGYVFALKRQERPSSQPAVAK